MVSVAVPAVSRPADRLLLAGALAGPTFFVSATTQALTREGFDITRHPFSQLATGNLGWIQVATFVLAGLGCVSLAFGIKRRIIGGAGRRALPLLVGIFGAGLIAAGLFRMDEENGFPPGTPDGPVAQMSWHGVAHSAAAAVAFTALAIAAIVLTVRHIRQRAALPAALNTASAVVLLLPMWPEHMSVQIAVNGAVAFAWTTVLAIRLRRDA